MSWVIGFLNFYRCYQAVRAYTLNEWGELASHERLFNPPVLDLKARHSVVFIFSVIYILYYFLPFMFCILSGCGGGLGPGGGGGGGLGLLGSGPHLYLFIFDSF